MAAQQWGAPQAPSRAVARNRRIMFWALIGLLAAAALTITILVGIDRQSGTSAVFERISAETDCATLQGEFNMAERNHHTDYMAAADERMRSVGCYG